MSSAIGKLTGADDAAKASKRAAASAAASEAEKLAYLREVEKLPRAYREGVLGLLGSELGITLDEEGNVISSGQDLVSAAMDSPLYSALYEAGVAGLPMREDAIRREASRQGIYRSGNLLSGLGDVNAETEAIARANALTGAYGDLKGNVNSIMGLPSNANQIGQAMSNIGNIQAQGQIAAANAQQQGMGMLLSGLTTLGGAALGGPIGGAIGGSIGSSLAPTSYVPPGYAQGGGFNKI